MSGAFCRVMMLIRASGFWDFLSTRKCPVMISHWCGFTGQSRADCWERTAKVSAGYLCVWWCTPLTVLSISRPRLRGLRVTACLSMFVAFKCLCLPLMRRCWGFWEPPILSSYFQARGEDVERTSEKRNSKKEKQGVSGNEKGPCVSNSTLKVPGVLCPSSTPPHRPCFPLLCGCNQKGQIKGGGRVSLQHFSSQSCQSVAKSGALGAGGGLNASSPWWRLMSSGDWLVVSSSRAAVTPATPHWHRPYTMPHYTREQLDEMPISLNSVSRQRASVVKKKTKQVDGTQQNMRKKSAHYCHLKSIKS